MMQGSLMLLGCQFPHPQSDLLVRPRNLPEFTTSNIISMACNDEKSWSHGQLRAEELVGGFSKCGRGLAALGGTHQLRLRLELQVRQVGPDQPMCGGTARFEI